MGNSDEIIAQIEELLLLLTKDNYDSKIQEGYLILLKLRNLGLDREVVYQTLYKYYNTLTDNLNSNFIADILDFVDGWCSPQYFIWSDR